MIAVVYSGTKTAIWKIAKEGKLIAECSMPGINPFFVDQKSLLQQLNKKTTLIKSKRFTFLRLGQHLWRREMNLLNL
jgi:hypothetical protein